MNRMARGAFLCVVIVVALLALGSTAAFAAEGAAGGWYWQNPLAQGNALLDVCVNGDHVVAVGDAGSIFTSDNGGLSWARRASGMRGSKLLSVDFVSRDVGWASGSSGVMKTTDGGATWARQTVPGAGTYTFSSVSFVDANRGWACGSYAVDGSTRACRIVRTVNGGNTWTVTEQWTSGSSAARVQFLRQVDFVSPTTGWATGWGQDEATGNWGHVVLKTTDAGDTWTVSLFGDGSASITAMAFSSTTDGWAASGVIDGYVPGTIWKTSDGGATWVASQTREGSVITDLAATASGECFASGQAEGLADWKGFILHTTDAGATWREEYAEDSLKPNAVAFSATTAVAVGDGSLRLVRNSAAGTWNEYEPGVRKNLTDVQFWDSDLGWAVGWKSTILRTVNGGRTWVGTHVPSGISLEGIDMVTKKVGWAVGCSGPHVPYADMDAGYGAVVLKTTDGGLHWSFKLNRTTKPGLADVDFTDAKHGVAVGTAGLTVRTKDGGKTWWLRTVGSQTLRGVEFLSATSGVAVGGDTTSTGAGGSIWSTSNGGASWKQATVPQDEAHAAPLRAIFRESTAEGSTLTAVGDRSQIYSSSDGTAWSFSDLTPEVIAQDPPYMLGLDIGLTSIASPELVAEDDVTGWVLSDEGSMWTRNGSGWQLPPTVASFSPTSGNVGTTLTISGSGFDPKMSRNAGSIGWVLVTEGGSGYTTAPAVTIAPPLSGRQATATATIDATGAVTGVVITDGGSGYARGEHAVMIEAPPAGGVQAQATAYSVSAVVEFAGEKTAVPSSIADGVITVDIPADALTGRFSVTTVNGTAWSPDRVTIAGATAEAQTHLSDHAGASGQDNQLNGLAVVNWVNAWAVGDRGTILSFDRLAPKTTLSPSNGWINPARQMTLIATDGKSGVRTIRWVVDPPGVEGNVAPPIGDWDSWPWSYSTSSSATVTFSGPDAGYAPGSRHVIYYQALDDVGNMELDQFWRNQALDDPEFEVPKHLWVTCDRLGPQTYAPSPVTVKRNAKPVFEFWVNDDLSQKAKVTIVVKNGAGSAVKTFSLGWLPTAHEFSSPIADWKCTLAKGSYTFDVLAEDQAGNTQIEPRGHNAFVVN